MNAADLGDHEPFLHSSDAAISSIVPSEWNLHSRKFLCLHANMQLRS